MDLLLHICCGPCSIYPLRSLREQGHNLTAFFHNPNIHPFREFSARLGAAEELARQESLPLEVERSYGLRTFLRQVVGREDDRCRPCYQMRLAATAERARSLGLDGFTSSLLYSRHQRHELIRAVGEEEGKRVGVPFCYQDFRPGWQEGIAESKQRGLYRQQYCGCIFSEEERYDPARRPAGRKPKGQEHP